MDVESAWDVTLSDGTILVEVKDASAFSETDGREVVAKTELLLLDTDASIVLFDGLAVDQRPTKAMADVVNALEHLAESYGKQLIIGPI